MRIYLTGFMAAGKTTVGRILAGKLELPFVDLDSAIEARAGSTIPEIFAAEGEASFRKLERETLLETFEHSALVVATGGGTLADEENLRRVAERGTSVWLDPPFEVLVGRILAGGGRVRPLWTGRDEVETLYRRRLPAYRRADLHLPVSAGEPPSETAERIRVSIGGSTCAT